MSSPGVYGWWMRFLPCPSCLDDDHGFWANLGSRSIPGSNFDTCRKSGAALVKFPMSNAHPLPFFLGASWQDEGSGLIEGIFIDATVHDSSHLMRLVAQLSLVTLYTRPKAVSDA